MPVDAFNGTVYIHIGPHKTGTTSIQSFFSKNYDALISQGVLYPLAGRLHDQATSNAHHPLAVSIIDDAKGEIQKFIFDLECEIKTHQPHKLLFSTEVLAREWLTKDVFEVIQNLLPNSRRVWITVLRKQDELLLSHYQEGVKINSVKSPRDGKSKGKFVSSKQIWQLETAEILDHNQRIEKLKSCVGNDEVHPLLFGAIKRNLYCAMLDVIEVKIGENFRMPNQKNESLPWRVVYALQSTNHLPKPLARRASRTIRAGARIAVKLGLKRLLAGTAPLSEADRQNVLQKYATSNRQLCEKYFKANDAVYL